ncbi:MAG: hypothetical protein HC884_13095 [Chloroflexaceae bacterium]|nr:hypothetical protein [Chloroflexaceae bacterium]
MMGASEQRTAEQIADELGEKDLAKDKIIHIASQCGLEFINALFEQTMRVEEGGGLMVKDRSRRRTPGGVFFYLVKERLKEEQRFEDLDRLFPPQPREQPQHQPPPLVPRMRPRPRVGVGALPSSQPAQPQPRRTATESAFQQEASSRRMGPLDQHQAIETIRMTLGDTCYKVSASVGTRTMTARFLFPDIAGPQYAQVMETLKAQTGWDIVVHPLPHQGKLAEVARQVLPPSLLILGDPSIHQNDRMVTIRCHGDLDEPAWLQSQETFQATTGWTLCVKLVS